MLRRAQATTSAEAGVTPVLYCHAVPAKESNLPSVVRQSRSRQKHWRKKVEVEKLRKKNGDGEKQIIPREMPILTIVRWHDVITQKKRAIP